MQSGQAINLNLNDMTTGATVFVANQMPVSVTVSTLAVSVIMSTVPVTITAVMSTIPVNVQNLPSVQQVYWAMPQDVAVTGVLTPVDVTGSTVSVNVATHVFVDNQISVSSHVVVDNQVSESTSIFVTNFSSHVIVDNAIQTSTHVSVDNFPATQAVTGTFFQATQPVSISSTSVSGSSVTVQNFPAVQQVQASSGTVNAVSLGTSAGKTAVLRTGSLVTTAVTANQVVSTYTVTAGKTFYMEYITASARLTVLSATASILGTFSFQVSGVNVLTETNTNPTIEQVFPMVYWFAEPIPFPGGTGIAVVCTPAATTSMTWTANFGGYER